MSSALNTMVGGNHYKEGCIQPIEFFMANSNLDFCQANIIKYAFRHKNKNGIQDLLKVIHYSLLASEFNYGDEGAKEFRKGILSLIKS